MKTATRFYIAALAVVLVGGVDCLLQYVRKAHSGGGINATDTASTATTATTTASTTATTDGPCLGLTSMTVGVIPSPPLVTTDNNQGKGLVLDVIRQRLESAGCHTTWNVVDEHPSGVDLVVGSPAAVGRLITNDHWLATKPYAVVKLKEVKGVATDLTAAGKFIWADAQWSALVTTLYPGTHVTPKPAAEAVRGALHEHSVSGAVVPEGTVVESMDANHHAPPRDVPLLVAVSSRLAPHLDQLNELFVTSAPADLIDKAAAANHLTSVKRP
jgi:hypothetical protein